MYLAILTNHGFGFFLYTTCICVAVTRFSEDVGLTAPKSYIILISGFSLSLSFSLIVLSMSLCCPLASSCRLIAPLTTPFTTRWTSFSKNGSSQFGIIFPMLLEYTPTALVNSSSLFCCSTIAVVMYSGGML